MDDDKTGHNFQCSKALKLLDSTRHTMRLRKRVIGEPRAIMVVLANDPQSYHPLRDDERFIQTNGIVCPTFDYTQVLYVYLHMNSIRYSFTKKRCVASQHIHRMRVVLTFHANHHMCEYVYLLIALQPYRHDVSCHALRCLCVQSASDASGNARKIRHIRPVGCSEGWEKLDVCECEITT